MTRSFVYPILRYGYWRRIQWGDTPDNNVPGVRIGTVVPVYFGLRDVWLGLRLVRFR